MQQPQQQQQNFIFKEEDIEELIKHSLLDKNYSLEKVTKRILAELAQTFLEETLDLPPSDKNSLNVETLKRQISIKFPEVAREGPNVEIIQRRNMEIDREDFS